MFRVWKILLVINLFSLILLEPAAWAEPEKFADSNKASVSVLDFFSNKVGSGNDFFTIPDVKVEPAVEIKPQVASEKETKPQKPESADQLKQLDPNAPKPFQEMAKSYWENDIASANRHADEYIRYLVKLMYDVRELTKIIGAAMIRQGVIQEEDWVGVEQYLDYEFAMAREENHSPLKATHSEAMKHIVADADNRADVYFFFNLSSDYCRKMAPDVERLWQVAQSDPRIKMKALLTETRPLDWVESFQQYSGLTAPVLDGTEVAKSLKIGMVPALVVISPSNKKAYVKTGLQSFARMYEFVRTVQGLPVEENKFYRDLVNRPIGEVELLQASSAVSEDGRGGVHMVPASVQEKRVGNSIKRF